MSRSSGMGPSAVRHEVMVDQLSGQLNSAFRLFHDHCKVCRHCRNPMELYQNRRDFCPIGSPFTVDIIRLLYLKAEYMPTGSFRVEYKSGWTEIGDLIKVICHNKQGEYTTKVVDLKRARPRSPPLAIEDSHTGGRGSMYSADIAKRNGSSVSPQNKHRRIESNAYADPRNSYLSIPDARNQHSGCASPASSHSDISSNGRRSVHFDSRIRVREFEDDR